MKIEITNEGEFYNIYKDGEQRPLKNMRSGFMSPFAFYDDDILKLLDEKQHDKFLKGEYKFNVSKSHLQFITGERLAQTRQELQMYPS